MDKFDTRLQAFVKATKDSQAAALDCSNMAIAHYQEHGDLGYCQRFMEAMPKNYLRRTAFLAWLAAHAPVIMKAGTLKKDTSEAAIAFDIAGALAKPFWDFLPEKPITDFGFEDVKAELKRVLSKYSNPEKYKATDDKATQMVTKATKLVEAL